MSDQTVRDAINQAMRLSPQENFLLQHHFRNLHHIGTGGGTLNPDGSYSTILQRVEQGPDGRFYNIPSVWNGNILPRQQAVAMAAKTGWDKWPAYATPDEADARYMQMHQFFGDVPPPAQVGPH